REVTLALGSGRSLRFGHRQDHRKQCSQPAGRRALCRAVKSQKPSNLENSKFCPGRLGRLRKIAKRLTLSTALSLERAKGIEPSYAAWEAAVLPLNYARSFRLHE